ncbi:uncharacterized protein [Lolium perenne]|uniref:uncharacterized protein isoform X3 n=1 Tax=Lolium perenne TaxID=4522 RepID=UPI0021F635E5|nr:uncharacterized protein LOC127343370 isoform X3 [Lolium perenne]
MAEVLPGDPPPLRPAASTQRTRAAMETQRTRAATETQRTRAATETQRTRAATESVLPSSDGERPVKEAMGIPADREVPRCAAGGAVFRVRRGHGHRSGDISTRRFGDNLLAGYTRDWCSSSHDADFMLSSMDSLSPSDKENVYPTRNSGLDEALFQFIRKEAIKSVKRDFTDFCNGSNIWSQSKRANRHEIGRESFISYSIKYYWEVLKCLSNERKEVIRKFGFGCLLLYEKSEIPSSFVRWLASCVDPVSSQIIVDGSKIIPIAKSFVHFVIGLPNSGVVPLPNSDGGAKLLMSLFHLSELPHITYFGNKLKSKEVLTDKEIFVSFMVIAFKCFLFPTSDDFPNTDYLHILDDPDASKGFDLCELVYDHLIAGVHKLLKVCKLSGRKPREFEFCYYFLAVYYLDSLDFCGRKLDDTIPRISVWKGNLIKFFSGLDLKENNIFGKRHFKKILAPCYRDFGKDLDAKIIDGIIASVCSVETGNHGNVNKSEIFVTNVLQFMLDMKLSELKIPTTSNITVPVFGAGNCEVPAGTSNYNNAFGIQDKYMKVDEYDIARNLEVISPEGLPHASSSSKSFSLKYASPECLITTIDGPYGSKTAPEIHPLRKVKARLHPEVTVGQHLPSVNTYPCGVKDFREFILPDGSNVVENDVRSVGGYVVGNDVAAPIARLNFLESPNNKKYKLLRF